ncbi:hypothetical protein MYK68_14065 [Gordonia sp. PP30]|uniref:hypothetical protein n=1 Tax=Gordonia sp. PP30 TaxID=2935861 RepID=UPI001FFFD6B3|nr:hypothetical protein [Gordonia sp. PP30]UQE73856.1 hypothetical protein MYK68_14065 [Gordonia sp. PP30]
MTPDSCPHRTNTAVPALCESCAHPHPPVLCRYCGIRMSSSQDQAIGAHLDCLMHHHYDLRKAS